jgi:adenine/guanine phosphoribosyltransferase-like PRPP-binding protein
MYLAPYLKGKKLALTIEEAILKVRNVKFDTIAVRGHSGMLVGAAMAAKTWSDLIIVRKDGEMSHSEEKVEGWGKDQRILIVDDFIESGSTIDQIYESIMEKCDSPTIVGILLYASINKQVDKQKYEHPDGTQFQCYHIYRGIGLARNA